MVKLAHLLPGIGSTVVSIVVGYFAAQIYSRGDLASAVITGLAFIGIIVLAIAGWGMSFALIGEKEEETVKVAKSQSDEILRIYMARQKAMLETLDETVVLLKEIRDVLKGGVGNE
ncbi:MAG: hypothetical protein DRJ38_05020 [Thermoprotei archaeon]|nr:MAG: hypothetical protein DRJ38_05020 [Thermoprotei archaeon]